MNIIFDVRFSSRTEDISSGTEKISAVKFGCFVLYSQEEDYSSTDGDIQLKV
jgi:hypothetical protein